MQGKTVNLQIWDTAGQEQFKSLIPGYIRDAKIVVLVYDISDPKTLKAAKDWYNEVIEIQGSEPLTFLVGNKSDLPRNVTEKEAKEAAQGKMTTFETCAKTGENILALFKAMGESVVYVEPSQEGQVDFASPIEPEKRQCSC